MSALGIGLVSCQRYPGDPRDWRTLYAEALEIAEVADKAGLDSIWTTEHHFVDDGYMPSLLVVAAAMAARTERIRIGTGVVLAPLHHPLRLAEDAATVELISGGRLLLGLGLGWSELEFEAFDAEHARRGVAMDDILTILAAAFSGGPVTHHGVVHSVDGLAVTPVPSAPVPIWMGGNADAALRRIGRHGNGLFSNASPSRFAEQVEMITAERERVGRDGPFEWAHYQYAWPADDPDEGWAEIREAVHYTTWKYEDMEASARRSAPLPAPPRLTSEMDAKLRARTLVGPSDFIAEQLAAPGVAAGVDLHAVARCYFPGVAHNRTLEQVVRIAEEVAPLLR